MLVPSIGIGTDRQWQRGVADGHTLQRIANGFWSVVNQLSTVNQVGTLLRNHDFQLLRQRIDHRFTIGFRQGN